MATGLLVGAAIPSKVGPFIPFHVGTFFSQVGIASSDPHSLNDVDVGIARRPV